MKRGGPVEPGVPPDQAALARELLGRAYEAQRDASLLHWDGGSLRGAALRAADATILGARALLATRGLDRTDPAAVVVLFDRQLVATDHVSRACGEVLHRAHRARRELEETDHPGFYAARVQSVREGAAALLAEARILLERAIGDMPPPPPRDPEEEDA